MIRYLLKDFSIKEQQYKVLAIHETGLALEIGIGIAEPLKNIIDVLNQASMSLEVHGTNSFFRGNLINGEAKRVEEVNKTENKESEATNTTPISPPEPEIQAGETGVGTIDSGGDTVQV